MAEFPALPLWTDAYLGDTTHLTTFEHGAYLLIIIVSWRSPGCCVPDDDGMLARYSRTTVDKWRRLRPILEPFFTISDGFWHQARLQDEFQHLQSRKSQQSEAGTASAKAKALKRGNRGSTPVRRPLQRNGNGAATPIPTPIPIVDDTVVSSKPRARRAVVLADKPDDVSDDVWRDFQTLRKNKGAPITETAIAGIRREATKAFFTMNEALSECCTNGWQGFKADWVKGRSNGNGFGRNGFLGAVVDAERADAFDEGARPGSDLHQ